MSRFQSTRHRLPLMAGSSCLAMGVLGASAFLTVAAAPSGVLAQVCSPTAAAVASSGPGADTVVCTVGTTTATQTFNPGISYTTNGDLTVSTAGGRVTVGTVAGGNGINLTASGADSITWNSTLGTVGSGTIGTDGQVTGGNFTNGPVIDAVSATGNITLLTDRVSGSSNTATAATNSTHAVRAISNGGGDVTIHGEQFNGSGTAGATPPGIGGIEARSLGGGDVSIKGTNINGRLYGILAEVTGAGTFRVEATGNVSALGGSGGVGSLAGIDLTAGTGEVTLIGGFGGNTGGSGAIVRAGGNVNLTGSISGGQYGLDLRSVAAGTTSNIDITGSASGGLSVIRAVGAGTVDVDISGQMTGGVDFTGLTTRATIDVLSGGSWTLTNGGSVQSAGGVTIGNAEGGVLTIVGVPASTTTFTGTSDIVNNAGLLAIGRINDNLRTFEANVVLAGIEVFNHSGVIALGQSRLGNSSDPGFPNPTDGWYDDILSMPGVHFVGQGGEISVDVNMNAIGGQTSCSGALRNADGDMPAADCVALIGGSTEGQTFITIVDVFPGDRGAYSPNGTVIIDVSGGTSAQGHFVVGPNSAGYTPDNGGMIDKGVFAFTIAYDETTQQHKLVGLPSAASLQFPVLANVGHDLWRTSTGTWFDRQADLRGDIAEGIGGGVWLRTSAEFADRDLVQSVEVAGQSFSFDNTFAQDSYAVTGGIDLLSGSGGDTGYVVGLMVGYAHADIDYDASPNKARFNGGSLGGYASFISGGLFLDAAVNANRLTMREDVPAFDFFPTGTLASTRIVSLGAQVEAGWRFPVMDDAFVEPVAGLSYVRAKWDNLQITPDDPSRTGAEVEWDDPTSLRGSVGARAGIEQDYGLVRAQYSLLGRVWNEFQGEADVVLHNLGPDAFASDDFGGQFTELGLGASVYGLDGAVSGFLNLGGKFGDDYEARTASAGVRVNW